MSDTDHELIDWREANRNQRGSTHDEDGNPLPRMPRFADVDEMSAAFVELEAIVRDLAAADGETGVDIVGLWTRATAWVSAHPVSGDHPDA